MLVLILPSIKVGCFFHHFSVFFYREAEKQKEIAELEAWTYKLIELLSEQRAATKDNIQRKQARTGGLHSEATVLSGVTSIL